MAVKLATREIRWTQLREPAAMAKDRAGYWLKQDGASTAFRKFLALIWMGTHITSAPQRHKRKAPRLADAITLANNHLAINGIRRLETTRGTIDDGTLEGYTPLPAAAREPLVFGKPVKFRNFLPKPRKPKAVVGAAPAHHPANVQEIDDESDGCSDDKAVGPAGTCAPQSDATTSSCWRPRLTCMNLKREGSPRTRLRRTTS